MLRLFFFTDIMFFGRAVIPCNAMPVTLQHSPPKWLQNRRPRPNNKGMELPEVGGRPWSHAKRLENPMRIWTICSCPVSRVGKNASSSRITSGQWFGHCFVAVGRLVAWSLAVFDEIEGDKERAQRVSSCYSGSSVRYSRRF